MYHGNHPIEKFDPSVIEEFIRNRYSNFISLLRYSEYYCQSFYMHRNVVVGEIDILLSSFENAQDIIDYIKDTYCFDATCYIETGEKFFRKFIDNNNLALISKDVFYDNHSDINKDELTYDFNINGYISIGVSDNDKESYDMVLLKMDDIKKRIENVLSSYDFIDSSKIIINNEKFTYRKHLRDK